MKQYFIDVFIIIVLIWFLFYQTITSLYSGAYGFFVATRLLLVIVIILQTMKCFKAIFYNLTIKRKHKGYSLSIVVLLFCFLVLESIFMFIPRSHGAGSTLGAKVWRSYYGPDMYSIRSHDLLAVNNKPLILFVGDSFTWGHGIKNVQDRFSNIVAKKSKSYKAVNIGICGLDSKQEFEHLKHFISSANIIPDKIVLQYFGNDIQQTAVEHGIVVNDFLPYSDLNYVTKYIVKGSFLINFVYWLYPHYERGDYFKSLGKAYSDETLFKKHTNDLLKIIDYTKSNSIELVVVVFPFMQNVPMSETLYTKKITNFFNLHGVKTVDLSVQLRNTLLEKKVVNNSDAHPSVYVNEVAADEIINLIKR